MAVVDPIKSARFPQFGKRCVDIRGQKFGRLTVKEFAGRDPRGLILWLCECECSKTTLLHTCTLRSGIVKSCGCLQRETTSMRFTKHGMTETAEYRTWCHMKGRCERKDDKDYKDYGGRGISVCERWRNSFDNFFADMGTRPHGCSIDRVDVNGNYEPNNCRWATNAQQAFNKRGFKKLDKAGESLTVSEWSKKLGIPIATLKWRIKHGWTVDQVLLTK